MSKIFIFIIAAAMLLVSAPTTLVSAESYSYLAPFIVTSKSGVNLRDKNCNIIDKALYQTVVNIGANSKVDYITCKVGGISIEFVDITIYKTTPEMPVSGYVAKKYLTEIVTTPLPAVEMLKVNTKNGLNLRGDGNCKKITTLPNNAMLKMSPVDSATAPCKVGGVYYGMILVSYNGKLGVVASKYVATI